MKLANVILFKECVFNFFQLIHYVTFHISLDIQIQWTLESRTQSVPRGSSTFNFFNFRVKFPHKK